MHTDEAVNAYITGQLLDGERFRYDPQDRHGSALYLAALPVEIAAGARNLAGLSETSLRVVPAIWGALTVILFAAIAKQTGLLTAAGAAFLFAFAPLPVYYSRYFIHETLFVTATLACLLSGWRALESGSWKWALAFGTGGAVMLACKETALLHFVAFGVAGLGCRLSCPRGSTNSRQRREGALKVVVIALCVFAMLVVALYSWGGQHWQGPVDLLRSIPRFAARASGEGHEKPFLYYAVLMGRDFGWTILVFAAFGGISLTRITGKRADANLGSGSAPSSNSFLRFVLGYGGVISLIYSFIPYKTPWLALNLWLPMALLAGFGFATLCAKIQGRCGRILLALVGCAVATLVARDTWRWCYQRPADEQNPYAYSHTGEDLVRLPERLKQLTSHQPPGSTPVIAVIAEDPWPLPWYLRGFHKVGYWQLNEEPGRADFYITSSQPAEKVSAHLKDRRPEFFGVRPGVLILLWTPLPDDRHD